MKYRLLALGLSLLLALASLVLLGTKGVNFSVDFTGGVSMQVEFPETVNVGEIRTALSDAGQGQATIQAYDDKNILIRYQDASEDTRKQILETLRAKFGDAKIQQVDTVGPVVGQELRVQALQAVLFAIVGILIYMGFRFSFRFGVATVTALAHDSIIMLGVYSLTGREISTSFIAAVLTIIGYSLNDSIVVLDRVRENWSQLRSKGVDVLINDSINQTLSRTINTSLTTLLPVIAMFLLGGEVISNLAFAFLVGIVVGTYSSIFIASAILVEWYQRKPASK